ncbi:MAG: DUF2231 domain-containing protein [Deltaproteobacteria bacterium]|nr:DUF2231 domain-containing protein [Deltaproteobacteria bacterium]
MDVAKKHQTAGIDLIGHRVHQMLVAFPLGLLAGATIFDVVGLVRGAGSWSLISYWLIAAGVVVALIAAIFGAIDWGGIPAGSRAKRVATVHGVNMVIVVVLFSLSWFARREPLDSPGALALTASFTATALALFGGWLGAELVNRMGVGVYDQANINATSSVARAPHLVEVDAAAQ